MPGGNFAVGIDIGGTNTKLGIIDRAGKMLLRRATPTEEAKGGEHLLAKLVTATRQLIADADKAPSEFAGIGIGSPGLIDVEKGMVADCPGKIPGWTGMPVAARIGDKLGLATFVDNDVKVIARGEGWMGAGRGFKHFVCFALGTGIGGGIVIDGKIYHGASFCSGMVGHIVVDPNGPRCICGGRGCLESLASGSAIAAQAVDGIMRGMETSIKELADGDLTRVDASLVFQAAQEGDQFALEIVQRAGYYLGIAVVTTIHLLNPQRVIIGGGVAQGGKLLLEPVRRTVKERAWQRKGFEVEIVPSELGDDAGIFGSARLAFDQTDKKR